MPRSISAQGPAAGPRSHPSCLLQIYFYSFEVFRTAQFEEGLIPYVSLGVGLCEFVSSILCVSPKSAEDRRVSSAARREAPAGRRRLVELWGAAAAGSHPSVASF